MVAAAQMTPSMAADADGSPTGLSPSWLLASCLQPFTPSLEHRYHEETQSIPKLQWVEFYVLSTYLLQVTVVILFNAAPEIFSNSNLRLRRVCQERWQNGCWDLPKKCHVKSELGVFFVKSPTRATLCLRMLAVSSSSVGSRPRTQSCCAVCVVTLTHHCTAVLASHWFLQECFAEDGRCLRLISKKITIWSIMRVLRAFFGSGWYLQGEIFGKKIEHDWRNCFIIVGLFRFLLNIFALHHYLQERCHVLSSLSGRLWLCHPMLCWVWMPEARQPLCFRGIFSAELMLPWPNHGSQLMKIERWNDDDSHDWA